MSVAVVGSRAATPAAGARARALAAELAGAGLTIVSGLARGIDTAAHEGALAAKGRTVAVLGSGLDRIYPDENRELGRAIAAEGAVVSEFPLGTRPHPGFFPRRNRIIAGWGRAVVVVEASAKSGALITARCALEEGRDVMAVPGTPGLENAEGTNALIRDGAALVRHAVDVLSELGLAVAAPRPEVGDPLVRLLASDRPVGLDELQAKTGWPAPELLRRLSELELADAVRRLPGPTFVRS